MMVEACRGGRRRKRRTPASRFPAEEIANDGIKRNSLNPGTWRKNGRFLDTDPFSRILLLIAIHIRDDLWKWK